MFRFCMFCVFLCWSCVYGAAIPKNDGPPPVKDSKPNAVPNINIQPLPNADANVVPNRNVQPLPNEDAKDIPNRNVQPLPNADAKDIPNRNVQPLPNEDAKDIPNRNVQPLPNEDAKDVPNRNNIPLPMEDANVVPNRNDAPLAIEDAHILNRKEAPVADMVPNRNESPLKNEDFHVQHMDVERPPLVERKHNEEQGMQKKNAPSLKTSDLQPPDHLDAVRMEQDGHLNRDFKKEVFAGNHEEYEEFNRKHAKTKLEEIFLKVDVNRDHYIEQLELENWIVLKVNEHFDEAAAENDKVFQMIDTDNDGGITWNEFQVEFLVALGKDRQSAMKYNIDDENLKILDKDREKLVRFKFRWSEADRDPQDNVLSIDEFKAFRHPEQSKHMLDNMVTDIVASLDRNGDGILTEEEFIALPPGEVEAEFKEADTKWQEERRKEFRENIDMDHDGRTSLKELQRYVDPRNPHNALLEAENLIRLADANDDGKLSLKEVIDNIEVFIGSKMMDTGRSFHDEF